MRWRSSIRRVSANAGPGAAGDRSGLPRWKLALGLAAAYGLLWHLQVLLGWAGVRPGPEGPPSILIWNWIAAGGLLALVRGFEGRSARSIGLRTPRASDLAWAVAFWAASTVASGVVHTLAPPPPSEGLDAILALPIPVLVAVIVTASITEELFFRGYLVERLGELTGRLWLAAAVSMALFAFPHVLFFGAPWLLYHGWATVALYALYLWRRNLWACMLLHLLGNALVLIPALGLAGTGSPG